MLALVAILSTLLAVNNAYQYITPARSFENAKAYCKSIGTTLATIVTDDDRAAARAAIPDGVGGVWIGLEDVSETEGGYFSYPDEEEDVCVEPAGLCVDFWIEHGEPICANDGGYTCTQFYQTALEAKGGVNNDVSCDTERPFLCNDSPPMSVCIDQDWTCNSFVQPLTKCGESGPYNYCFCDKDDVGDTLCVEDASCGSPRCSVSSDCSSGSICLPSSCCFVAICVPLCEEEITRRRQLGLMTDDEVEEYKENKEERERRKLMESDSNPVCTNSFCDPEVLTTVLADGNPDPAKAENGVNEMNDLENLMNNNDKMQLIELLSLNVMVSILVTLFVLCMVYICCFRGKQTMNKHEKDDKLKYDKVGGNVDEDEIDEMM